MREAFPTAAFILRYSPVQRARAAQAVLKLPAPPVLGPPVPLTPNAPYARDGSHLSFWKPSYVIGTAAGGEAGVNFWGLNAQGHVNVTFGPGPHLLDCRLLAPGPVAYKVYGGPDGLLQAQGERSLSHGHLLLRVQGSAQGDTSVELWPSSPSGLLGFLGCDLSTAR